MARQYTAMQHSTQTRGLGELYATAQGLGTICKAVAKHSNKHSYARSARVTLSLSLSLVSQFVIFFVCKAKIHKFCFFLWIATKSQATSRNDEWAKIHKFSVIANEPQGEVWQSIVKSGFCGLPRKNSLTLIFARNDGYFFSKIQDNGEFCQKIRFEFAKFLV